MEEKQEQIAPEVDKIIEKWKHEEGNLIMVLHGIQEHYGYIPRNISMHLSEKLDVPLARIYEVTTFYNYFNLEPPAKYTVNVCTGTACHLKGAPEILDAFRKELNLKGDAKYTSDNEFKIQEVRCIGCCGLAPAITINGEVHGKVKAENVKEMIDKVRNQ